MNMKKMVSCLVAGSMLTMAVSAFAQIPETQVSTIDNAAVVAFDGVNAHQSMNIEGDVYAGGQVKFDNAGENYLDGDIISSQEVSYQDEYSAILKDTNRKGVDKVEENMSKYLDAYYPDTYLTDDSVKPETPAYEDVEYTSAQGWVGVNAWSYPSLPTDENGYPYYTISENTSFDGLSVQGGKVVIDTTNGPVYVKVNQLSFSTANDKKGYIEVVGDNPAYLISQAPGEAMVNVVDTGDGTFDFGTGDLKWIIVPSQWGDSWVSIGSTSANSMICADIYYDGEPQNLSFNAPTKGDIVLGSAPVSFGNTFTLEGDIYSYGTSKFDFDGKITGDIVTKAETVRFANSGQYADERVTGNVNAINATSYEVSCHMVGNTVTSAETFNIYGGGANIEGTVYAPKADVKIGTTSGNGINRGQLICNSLDIYGEGAVIWGHAGNATPDVTPVPSEEPTPEPTEEPTPAPTVTPGEEVDLQGLGYAYIFGYEPAIQRVDITDEEGNVVGGKWVAEVKMAPDDAVTREQVAAMITRMVDQKYGTTDTVYPVTDNIAKHEGTWYVRGLAYLAQKGAFDGVDSVEIGAVTRGEVAKLLAYGLGLTKTGETEFTDIADSQYKSYIETVVTYGYMNGTSDTTFEPDRVMTRAEFCQMFNNVIGRTDMGLVAQDGTTVTPELYSIVDIDGHWAEDAMLKATSAYDDNGLIDTETRIANIRNVLDKYDSQTWY